MSERRTNGLPVLDDPEWWVGEGDSLVILPTLEAGIETLNSPPR